MGNKFQDFFDSIKEKISQIQFSFAEEENRKKILFIVFGILIFLIFILILILCFSPKDNKIKEDLMYDVTEYMYSPSSPEISSDYMYSRNPKNTWTEEEANEYVTLPNEEMLENLKESNDRLIRDILEASP